MHLEGVGPLHGAANKLLYALTKVTRKAHLLLPPDAARLSQALHLPKRNHTEENFPDLEVPSLTLQMRKQVEQARGLQAQVIWDSDSQPAHQLRAGHLLWRRPWEISRPAGQTVTAAAQV